MNMKEMRIKRNSIWIKQYLMVNISNVIGWMLKRKSLYLLLMLLLLLIIIIIIIIIIDFFIFLFIYLFIYHLFIYSYYISEIK